MRTSLLAAFVAVAALLLPTGTDASHDRDAEASTSALDATVHVRPVAGPVVDPFRPPSQPWLRGNRGIEFDTEPGSTAIASADGVVTFAGVVAGEYHVTIRHSARLRTTLAFVLEPLVVAGQAVKAGDAIAVVGDTVHFTARVDATYVDPALLLSPHRWTVRLIPPQ